MKGGMDENWEINEALLSKQSEIKNEIAASLLS